MFNKKFFLDVGFTDEDEKKVLEYIVKSVEKSQKKYYIVTPNPEILVIANKNPKYKKVLNGAKLALIDGVGIIWAAKILGKNLKHKISGVDLVENLCKEVAEKPITVGFLGAGPGVAERTAYCLISKYPSLKVTFAASELSEFESNLGGVSSSKYIVFSKDKNIQNTKYRIPDTDILFVAFGSPKQEYWIAENLEKLPVKVAIGVGGSFDMISGKTARAPKFIRDLGFEWLFRLAVQPWRIKRQLRLLIFLWLVLKEKLSQSSIA